MKNKYEALKLNLLKQQQELDMVHQRELQRKEERFSGELQRQEELPEVEERMRELLCHQHESFLKLLHELSGQPKESGGEDPGGPRGSMKTHSRKTHYKRVSEECGSGNSGNSGVIMIPSPCFNCIVKQQMANAFVFFVLYQARVIQDLSLII